MLALSVVQRIHFELFKSDRYGNRFLVVKLLFVAAFVLRNILPAFESENELNQL